MDNNKWKNLLLSWANVLELCDRELTNIEDFVTNDFFPRLMCKLHNEDSPKDRRIECAFKFLKSIYTAIDLDANKLNENDIITAATLFLLHSSLHQIPVKVELQEKLCSLPHEQQCLLKSLLEKFMSIEKSCITNEIILSEIGFINAVNNVISSPTSVTPLSGMLRLRLPTSSANSSKKASRVRRLRNQIEHLTSVQLELQEELESTNQKLNKLKDTLAGKDKEIARLKANINDYSVQDDKENRTNGNIRGNADCGKCSKLKERLQNLETERAELQEEILDLTKEKESKCISLQEEIATHELKLLQSQEREEAFIAEIDNLKSLVTELKKTYQEQLEYINELKTKEVDVSENSLSNLLISEENLGSQVIDLQIQELRQSCLDKDNQINNLNEELKTHKNDLNCCHKTISEHTFSIKTLNEQKENLISEIEDLRANMSHIEDSLQQVTKEKNCLEALIEQCKKDLNSKSDELINMQEENEKLYNILYEKDTDLKKIIQERNKLLAEIERKNVEILEYKHNLSNANEVNTILQKEIERQTAESDSMQSVLQSLDTTNSMLQKKIDYLESELKVIRNKLNTAVSENEMYLEKIKSLEDYVKIVGEEKEKLIDENNTLIGQINDYMMSENNYLLQMQEFKSKLTHQEHNIQHILKDNNSLINKISELNSEVSFKTCEIKTQQETINLIKERNEHLNKEIENISKELLLKSELADSKQNELNIVKDELNKIKSINENNESLLQHLFSQENVLKKLFNEMKDKIEEIRKLQQNKLGKHSEALQNRSVFEKEIAYDGIFSKDAMNDEDFNINTHTKSTDTFKSFTKDFSIVFENLDECYKTVNEQASQLEIKDKSIAALTADKVNLQQIINDIQKKMEQISVDLDSRKTSEKCLQLENVKLFQQINNMEKEKQLSLNNATELNKDLDSMKINLENLEVCLKDKDKLIENHLEENHNLLQIIKSKEQLLTEKDQDLSSKTEKVLSMESDIVQLMTTITELEQEISSLNENNSCLQDKLEFLVNDKNVLDKQIEEKEELVTDLRTKNDNLIEEINILKNEVNIMKTCQNTRELEINRLMDDNSKLLNNIALLKSDLDILKVTSGEAVDDRNMLSQTLLSVNKELITKMNILQIPVDENLNILGKLEIFYEKFLSLQNTNDENYKAIQFLTEQKIILEKIIEDLKNNLIDQLEDWDVNNKLEDDQFQKKVNQDLEKLRLCFTEKEIEIKTVFSTIEEKCKLFNDLSEKFNETKKHSDDITEKCKLLESRNKELNSDVDLLKEELTKMTEKEDNLKTNIRTLKADLFLKNRDLKAKTSEIKLLKDANNRSQGEINQFKLSVDSLQKTNDIIKESNNNLIQEIENIKKDLVHLLNDQNRTMEEITGVKSEIFDDSAQTLGTLIENIRRVLKTFKLDLVDKQKQIFESNVSSIPSLESKYDKQMKDLLKSYNEYRHKAEETRANFMQEFEIVKEKYLNAKLRINQLEANTIEMEKNIRAEYEQKLNKLKLKMKQTYQERLEDLSFGDMVEKLKQEVRHERGKVKCLESKLSEYSDQLLIAQEENRRLLSGSFAKPAPVSVFQSSHQPRAIISTPILKSHSEEILTGRNRGIDNLGHDFSPDDSFNSGRRSSIRSLPRGIGNIFSLSAGRVFPAAEEAGEVFDDRCLSDLKAGICHVTDADSRQERMSILQLRNSLCPPHLKSSYPIETQFLNPADLKEDDIKISYKKPSTPPKSKTTGNKVGGILKEQNKSQPKMSTPSRIKALFGYKPKDENSPMSKKGNKR